MKRQNSGNKIPVYSNRQRRVGEIIKQLISEAIIRSDTMPGDFDLTRVTITEVRMAADLKHAFAYFVPLEGKDEAAALEAVKGRASAIRYHVSQSLRMRSTPKLTFRVDDTFDTVTKLEYIMQTDKVQQDIADESASEIS